MAFANERLADFGDIRADFGKLVGPFLQGRPNFWPFRIRLGHELNAPVVF